MKIRIKNTVPATILLGTLILELLPCGAVCIFADGPGVENQIRVTYSYFSHIPYGYANFGPLLTAGLTCVLLLLAVLYLFTVKEVILKAMKTLTISAMITSLMPLLYGFKFFSLVGILITLTLITNCGWVIKELKTK